MNVHIRTLLELSDDSDIEVHPNVDKRSFVREKQNQIGIHGSANNENGRFRHSSMSASSTMP
jgi:Cdc37 N terminal kinase binding